MNNSTEFEMIDNKYFLPSELENIFCGNLPEFSALPDSIDVQNNLLAELLRKFREDSTEQLVELIKTNSETSRNEKLPFWRTEYSQSVIVDNCNVLIGSIIEGEIGRTNNDFIPIGTDRKLKIHSHPSNMTFSPKDLLDKTPLKIVMTDDGYWLSFPTNGIQAPQKYNFEDFWEFGNYGYSKNDSDLYKNRRIKKERKILFDKLIKTYGIEKMSPFLGEKLVERKYDPEEVNDRGVNLIQLYKALSLSEKYKIGLYYMGKNEQIFKRVTKIENVFPVLKI